MNTFWANFFFILFSLTAIMSAVYVVASKNLVRAAFSLFFTFFSVAGLYALLSADFLAVVQILVYVGGILILVIFGILFTKSASDLSVYDTRTSNIVSAILVILFSGIFYKMIFGTDWFIADKIPDFQPTTANLGNLFLSRYLLPFEVASVVLLVALIGSLFIARREVDKDD